jgi:hypothetical protein
MYVNGKTISVETLPGKGEERRKRMVEGVNSSMIHLINCRNICKCHNVHSASKTRKKEIEND